MDTFRHGNKSVFWGFFRSSCLRVCMNLEMRLPWSLLYWSEGSSSGTLLTHLLSSSSHSPFLNFHHLDKLTGRRNRYVHSPFAWTLDDYRPFICVCRIATDECKKWWGCLSFRLIYSNTSLHFLLLHFHREIWSGGVELLLCLLPDVPDVSRDRGDLRLSCVQFGGRLRILVIGIFSGLHGARKELLLRLCWWSEKGTPLSTIYGLHSEWSGHINYEQLVVVSGDGILH